MNKTLIAETILLAICLLILAEAAFEAIVGAW